MIMIMIIVVVVVLLLLFLVAVAVSGAGCGHCHSLIRFSISESVVNTPPQKKVSLYIYLSMFPSSIPYTLWMPISE